MFKLSLKLRLNLNTLILLLFSLSLSQAANSTETTANQSLDRLYQDISEERKRQEQADQEREQSFKQLKKEQARKLNNLKQELKQRQGILSSINEKIAEAKTTQQEKKKQLAEQSHALKDLFSIWKQAVKDGQANFRSSRNYHQYPDQAQKFEEMSSLTALPDSQDLRTIFDLFQKDIQQSSQIKNYKGEVIDTKGQRKLQSIQQIGTFSSTSEGAFLAHDPEINSLVSLSSQPAQSYLHLINQPNYKALQAGTVVEVVIDPSKGLILEQLALVPSWDERFHQGGYIGYVIVILGALGLFLSLYRWAMVSHIQLAINRQMKTPSSIDTNNPLGKILSAYEQSISHRESDRRRSDKIQDETLEVQLQEIVMTEMPKLDKGLGTIKLLAAIAPLLGLLGTVVGMINTFQSITLVGNADPRLMAGGISQALMTTVMGLLVAVPLLFSHNLLAAKTKKVVMFLTQQSLGFIVKHMQNQDTEKSSTDAKSAEK